MSVVSESAEHNLHFCYIHPTTETSLRCNKCGQYICTRCAVHTSVGYRCTRCVRQQQDVYFTIQPTDYAIAAIVSLVMSIPICFILAKALFLAIFLGAPAGGLISEAVVRLTGKRRGRYEAYVVGAAVLCGALIASLPDLTNVLSGDLEPISLLGVVVAGVLCAVLAGARFRPIR